MLLKCHAGIFKAFSSFTQPASQNGSNLPSLAQQFFVHCIVICIFSYVSPLIFWNHNCTVTSGTSAFRCVTSCIREGGGCKYFVIFSSFSVQYLLQQQIMSVAGGSVSGKRYITEKWKNKWVVIIAKVFLHPARLFFHSIYFQLFSQSLIFLPYCRTCPLFISVKIIEPTSAILPAL